MREYITYFDRNYLPRGLVLYRSLVQHGGEFHLTVICFDDEVFDLLSRALLDRLTPVKLDEFETVELRAVKPGRTRQEYCWSCTPASVLHVFNTRPDVSEITYLDADIKFFSSPEPIFEEDPQAGILLTEHRWAPGFELPGSGRFNVQFMTFKRSSLPALEWWHARCMEWCYARFEEGKFGDQRYLEDWPERFPESHIVRHPGAGVAPWNAANSTFTTKRETLLVDGAPLIFFHFHSFRLYSERLAYCYGSYPLPRSVRQLIYLRYFEDLAQARRDLRDAFPEFAAGLEQKPHLERAARPALRFLRGVFSDIAAGRYMFRQTKGKRLEIRYERVAEIPEKGENVRGTHFGEGERDIASMIERENIAFIERHLAQHKTLSLLDVGCGNGRYARLLKRSGAVTAKWRYTGVERSDEVAHAAARASGAEILSSGDSVLLPVGDRSYDLLFASSMLHYTGAAWREALREMARCAERCVVITRLPVTRTSPSFDCRQNVSSGAVVERHYFRVLNRDEFEAEAEKIGLRVITWDIMSETFPIAGVGELIVSTQYLFEVMR